MWIIFADIEEGLYYFLVRNYAPWTRWIFRKYLGDDVTEISGDWELMNLANIKASFLFRTSDKNVLEQVYEKRYITTKKVTIV